MPEGTATRQRPVDQNIAPPRLPTTWSELQIVRRFRAMNTNIDLYAMRPDVAPLLAQAEEIFHDVESRFTRFQESSELSHFNTRASDEFEASLEFVQLMKLAIEMHVRTGRAFDPGVLGDLSAAGYDRSFEQINKDDASPVGPAAHARRSIAEMTVDGSTIVAPAGLGIDFGGIGKGYAVDHVAASLRGVRDFLLSAGGDMRASGNGPGGDGWLVSIAPAPGDEPLSVVRLREQALATSTTALRAWRRAGRDLHHIIDPRTRQSAVSGVRAVSVIAPTAVEADVFAKTALILGAEEGLAFLGAQQTPGFFVLDDATCVQSADWPGLP